jgi:DNA repair protein RadC
MNPATFHDAEINTTGSRVRRVPVYAPSSKPPTIRRGPRMAGSAEVWAHMRDIERVAVEELWVLALDVRHRLISRTMCSRGTLTGVDGHPRDVFRPLIMIGAAAAIIVHNHPSGDPTPSRADIDFTQRLRDVGDLVGIPLLDHVIIGADGYTSLCERNWR